MATLDELLANEPEWVVPGTGRYEDLKRQADDRTVLENVSEGFQGTALGQGLQLAREEGGRIARDRTIEQTGEAPTSALDPRLIGNATLAVGEVLLFGERAGPSENYKEDNFDALIEGIPSQYHEEIFQGNNLASAQRARARIMQQLERGRRQANQFGLGDNLALMAGGLVDVDLPLALMTGGGFKAAQVAGKALAAGKALGLSPQASLRLSSAATGLSGGLQAGAVIGAAEANWTETRGWTAVADVALTTALMAGVANPILRGDRDVGIAAARDQLHRMVAEDNPALTAKVETNPSTAPVLQIGDTVAEGSAQVQDLVDSTAGAQAVTLQPGVRRTDLSLDPTGSVSETTERIVRQAEDNIHNSGWRDQKLADSEEWWTRVAMSGAFNLTTGNFRSLYQSDSAVLNFMAANVFESPHGLGRGQYTAAAGMENYHRVIMTPIARDVSTAANGWARRNNQTSMGSGFGISDQGLRQFNREIMLHRNEMAMGRTPTSRDPEVIQAAKAYEQAAQNGVSTLRGREGQTAVDGFEGFPDRVGYSPQMWQARRMMELEQAGIIRRDDVTESMANAYTKANPGTSADDWRAVAGAVINRAVARETEVDTNLVNLLSGDGREFLRESLLNNGMKDAEAEALIERLTGKLEDQGKENFAKSRNEIDLSMQIPTSDGSDVRIVDLLDQDLHGVWQRYARRAAGSAALARIGITNRAQRESFITAAQTEQRALGEEVMDADLIRAMFSNFNGGPVHGYTSFSGINEGVGTEIATIKRLTNLALLGKVAFAQLGETGASIVQVGYENWARRGVTAAFDKELKAGNKELLDDMSYIMGDLGFDHDTFAEWLDLDDVSRTDKDGIVGLASRFSSRGEYVQSMISAFNSVRGYQQRIASMGIVDRVVRAADESMRTGNSIDEKLMRRFQADLGLDQEAFTQLEQLLNSGVIEMAERKGQRYVNRININKWDPTFADTFASAITRNMNQVVQKSMAGEQDAWMSTHWGAIMTHLKTFPLQAIQKQFVRNLRHNDTQGLATLLAGVATAGMAISVRDAVDGKERTLEERSRLAFSYSNMLGWIPMFHDPAMTALGLEDLRFNAYGPHSDYTPPVISQLNRASRLPGAIADTITGEDDWYDQQSLRALPFSNLPGLHRILD